MYIGMVNVVYGLSNACFAEHESKQTNHGMRSDEVTYRQ